MTAPSGARRRHELAWGCEPACWLHPGRGAQRAGARQAAAADHAQARRAAAGRLPGPASGTGHRAGGVARVPARRRRAADGLAGDRAYHRRARPPDGGRPGAGDLDRGGPVGEPGLRHRAVPQARPGRRRHGGGGAPDGPRRQPCRRGRGDRLPRAPAAGPAGSQGGPGTPSGGRAHRGPARPGRSGRAGGHAQPPAAPPRARGGHLRLPRAGRAVGTTAAQARGAPRPARRGDRRPARAGAAQHRRDRVRRPGERRHARGADGRCAPPGAVRRRCGGPAGGDRQRAARGRGGAPAAAHRLGLAAGHRAVRRRATPCPYQGDDQMIRFLDPKWLLAIVPVLVLAGVYVWRQLRRRAFAMRFTNVELLRTLAPRGVGPRRHLAAGAFLASLVVLALGLARPSVDAKEPLERATVMLAIDVSLSMRSTDVPPTRIDAAKQAAIDFVKQLPPSFNVGLVASATGEAVFTCLDAIRSVPADGAEGPPPARVVLLSDGFRTFGRSIEDAAAAAAAANVPVSTIAFGTDTGTVEITGQLQRVPVDRPSLQKLAEQTKGHFYEAATLGELKKVYQDMGSSIGYRTKPREVTQWYVGVAMLFALAAAGLSLLWTSRLP